MPPILYSFRRCPYAMRARLAIAASGVSVELREVVLRDKPQAFLDTSPTATVPCLDTGAGPSTGPSTGPTKGPVVLDESLDIMLWALRQNDPGHWLDMPAAGHGWIARADGPFKQALDRTKYASRYPGEDPLQHRASAAAFLTELDSRISTWIFGAPSLADYAILPFVRQFAFIDKPWFDAQPWPALQAWLARFLASARFNAIMEKYPQWAPGDAPRRFP